MRRYLRDLWAEFKLFAFQGSLVELAVAVVLGAAFSGLVHAVVVDLINPAITYAVPAARTAETKAAAVAHVATSSVGLTGPGEAPAGPVSPSGSPAGAATVAGSQVLAVGPAQVSRVGSTLTSTTPVDADNPKAVQFQWYVGRFPIGHLIGEAINFGIVAFVVFLVAVKVLGGLVPPAGSVPAAGETPTRECPECLSIIPARARRCSHCTAVLDGRLRPRLPRAAMGRPRPMMRPASR